MRVFDLQKTKRLPDIPSLSQLAGMNGRDFAILGQNNLFGLKDAFLHQRKAPTILGIQTPSHRGQRLDQDGKLLTWREK
jgi:hypothetical protein